MPDTIADIIKESSEDGLAEAAGSLVNSGLTLFEQAKRILETDKRDFQRLGTNFLVPKKLDKSLDVKFNKFLAEPLLREGSLLLDRCLQQRKEYQELHAKWFEACVQIDEMLQLNKITKDEEVETYHLPIEIAQCESEALAIENDEIAKVSNSIEANITDLDSNYLDLAKAERSYMAYTTNISNSNDVVERIRANWEKRPLVTQKAQLHLQTETNKKRKGGADILVTLKKSSTEFQKERNDIARLVAERRAEQLWKENGALNFKEQMKPIKDRFKNDFIAAYLRLFAVNEGFRELYKGKFPVNSFPHLKNVEPDDLLRPELTDSEGEPPIDDFVGKLDFDDLVTWTQLTNTWLASFLDEQQLVTRSYSLRNLLEIENLQGTSEDGSWSFRLTENHFPDSEFIRLRSFAVQIDSGTTSGSWNISITPPTKAKIKQNSVLSNLDQGHVGTLYLGRVSERTYAVVPEGAAPPKLYNVSPIGEDSDSGKWTVSITGNGSTSGAKIEDIRDIDIHLTVALV